MRVRVQKARMASIRIVEKASRKAFLENKRKYEARLQQLQTAQRDEDAGSYNDEDRLQFQHHHLFACLERTTVRHLF